jgi:hypothetical protein
LNRTLNRIEVGLLGYIIESREVYSETFMETKRPLWSILEVFNFSLRENTTEKFIVQVFLRKRLSDLFWNITQRKHDKRQQWSIMEVLFNYCRAWSVSSRKKERKQIYCGVVFNSSLNSLQLKTLFWSIPELWSCWCCPQFWYFLEFDYVSKVISIYLEYAI